MSSLSVSLELFVPALSIALVFGLYILLGFLLGSLVGFVNSWFPKSWQTHILRFRRPFSFVLALPFLWFGFEYIKLEGSVEKFSGSLTQAMVYFLIFWFLYKSSYYLFFSFKKISEKTSSTLDDQLVPILEKIVRAAIIILGILLILQSFGLQVFSLLAGLGLGGLALALAAKDTAANFFGSLMILLDQPFSIGDWVKVDDVEGTVEDIGLRSTRIRTFYNSVVVVPNSKVAMCTLDNLGKREYRRFRHLIGIEYGTPQKNIELFIQDLSHWLEENPKSRNEKNEVCLNTLGDSGMNILVYVFFQVEDWSEELIQRQTLIFKILELSKKHNCPIAFPTQTLWLNNDSDKKTDELLN